MSASENEKQGAGRPRKRASDEKTTQRYEEAHRLEQLRDDAAKQWELDGTVAAKVALCAAEQRVCSAWAAACRGELRHTEAEKYTKQATAWAQQEAKAREQLIGDRVDELYRRVVRRELAAQAAASEEIAD